MSVDKFGRYSECKTKKPLRGPKGEGFNLTTEGDFDIQGKKLKNVGDCVDGQDAVNANSLYKTCITISDENEYNAKRKRLTNLAEPLDLSDAANKDYVDRQITIKRNDTDETYSVHQYSIKDVAAPTNDGDAVNLLYVKNNCLQTVDTIFGSVYDAKNKLIVNLHNPLFEKEAVNVSYMNLNALCINLQQAFDAKSKRICNVAKPLDLEDVVNKKYLKEAVADLSYAIYKSMHKGRATIKTAEEWKSKVMVDNWDELFK